MSKRPATLGKAERLKSRKLTDRVFREGKKFSVPNYRIHFLLSSETKGLQCGCAVSSRYFKKAVDRNLLKRRTREAYRLHKAALQDALEQKSTGMAVYFVFTGQELVAYKAIAEAVRSALLQLQRAAG